MLARNFRRILTGCGLASTVFVATAISTKDNTDFSGAGVVRLGRAAFTVLDICICYRWNLFGRGSELMSREEREKVKSVCHKRGADKLLALCRANGGVYVKVGQHVAALDYLLPEEYVGTLRVLHSGAPANTIQQVKQVISEELSESGRCIEDVFKKIDPEPLGAASLAQVHRATLCDGSVVAIKVQHARVRKDAAADLRAMEALVRFASWAFPDLRLQWLVDETKRNVPKELDFMQEAENAERLARMHKKTRPWLHVPEVNWDLTTGRLLTMQYETGGYANDAKYLRAHGIDGREVCAKLTDLYTHMIFVDGFVHSDPHPGNILVRRAEDGSADIILLDHGLYAELSPEFRAEYAELWLSILAADREGMRQRCRALGVRSDMYALFACVVTGRSWDAVSAGVDPGARPAAKERAVMRESLPLVLPSIVGVLDSVNRQMLLVLKTNDLLRGIEHALGTGRPANTYLLTGRRCISAAYDGRARKAESRTKKFAINFERFWAILKFSFRYAVLSMAIRLRNLIGLFA